MNVLEGFVEGIRAQLAAAGVAGGDVEKHRFPPTEDDQLPIATVTWGADQAESRGGARTGIPTFVHTVTLVIELADEANDGPALRAKMSTHGQLICDTLLKNLSWGGAALEGVQAVRQIVDKPVESRFNLARLQVHIDALYASDWAPAGPADDFETISIGVVRNDETEIGATIAVPII